MIILKLLKSWNQVTLKKLSFSYSISDFYKRTYVWAIYCDEDESTILQIENDELSWIFPTALCNMLKLPVMPCNQISPLSFYSTPSSWFRSEKNSSYIYKRHFGKFKLDALVQKKNRTLSPLDENYVPPSKNLILNNSQKRFCSTDIFCHWGRKRDKSDVNKEWCISEKFPCNKSSSQSKISSNCYNCRKPFGMHEIVAKVGQTKIRKRVKQSSQLQRSTSRKYISKKVQHILYLIFVLIFQQKKYADWSWSNNNGLYGSLIKVLDQY